MAATRRYSADPLMRLVNDWSKSRINEPMPRCRKPAAASANQA
jgi:hypothetical protein